MGNQHNGRKKDKKYFEALSKLTNFTPDEVREWRNGFLKDCPNGQLTQETFQGIYQQFFPNGDASSFAKFVFNVFDKNGDGMVEFEEFMFALSITSRGTVEEKLNWAFNLYDIDHDNTITKAEFTTVVTAIFEMLGQDQMTEPEGETPQARVDKIFSIMDKNNDGVITRQEFIEGAKFDGDILRAITLYDDLL